MPAAAYLNSRRSTGTGGKREGAGRKPKGRRALVSHKARPRFEKPVEQCLADALGRFGLRIIQFSVMGNHLHLIVEADSSTALSRGMQGLNVRLAKALNRMMGRKGRVFADHYHSRIVRTPTELVAYSSASLDAERRERVLAHPRSWLLRSGWRRARTGPHRIRPPSGP